MLHCLHLSMWEMYLRRLPSRRAQNDLHWYLQLIRETMLGRDTANALQNAAQCQVVEGWLMAAGSSRQVKALLSSEGKQGGPCSCGRPLVIECQGHTTALFPF